MVDWSEPLKLMIWAPPFVSSKKQIVQMVMQSILRAVSVLGVPKFRKLLESRILSKIFMIP